MVSRIARIAVLLGINALSATVTAQPEEVVVFTPKCAVSDEDGYDYKVEPLPGITLHWTLNPADDISLKAKWTDIAAGWVSVGFSRDGYMIGSDAVVGSAEGVFEYELGSKALPVQRTESPLEASIRQFSEEDQEITDAVLEITSSASSLSFTRPMIPEVAGKQVLLSGAGTQAILLWAAGSDDAFGYHFLGRGAFAVDLVCSEGQPVGNGSTAFPTEAPSFAPEYTYTFSPTSSPASPQPEDDGDASGSLSRLPCFVASFAGAPALGVFTVAVLFVSAIL